MYEVSTALDAERDGILFCDTPKGWERVASLETSRPISWALSVLY